MCFNDADVLLFPLCGPVSICRSKIIRKEHRNNHSHTYYLISKIPKLRQFKDVIAVDKWKSYKKCQNIVLSPYLWTLSLKVFMVSV